MLHSGYYINFGVTIMSFEKAITRVAREVNQDRLNSVMSAIQSDIAEKVTLANARKLAENALRIEALPSAQARAEAIAETKVNWPHDVVDAFQTAAKSLKSHSAAVA